MSEIFLFTNVWGVPLPLSMSVEVFCKGQSWGLKVNAPMHMTKEIVCPTTFSKDFTPHEVANSSEAVTFMGNRYGLKLETISKWTI